MSIIPPLSAVKAIESGESTITRRVEIYEADGITPILTDLADSQRRAVGGGVSIDYSRDERRTLDLTLMNDDGLFRPRHDGGMWYDKVIKLYRGVRYRTPKASPSIVIVNQQSTSVSAELLKKELMKVGFTNITINLTATRFEDIAAYDVIYAFPRTGTVTAETAALLNQAYASGKAVMTHGIVGSLVNSLPFKTVAVLSSTQPTWTVSPVTGDIPISKDWGTETTGFTGQGWLLTGLSPEAIPVATGLDGSTTHYTGVLAENNVGGRWAHLHTVNYTTTKSRAITKDMIGWLLNWTEWSEWETQIGEFMVDNITEDHFPYQVKVVGRDYTKKCLNSKLERATAFEAGTDARSLIIAVATNAGITKFKIPELSAELSQRLDYAIETPRWQIMKDVANSFDYDIFFDPQGYLTMRPFQDPSFSAVTATFKTGPDGNLVSYSRSINDSRLYNHVVVVAEVEGSEGLPYWGEAKNTEPSSPTRISRIGDRLAPVISNPALGSDEACYAYAMSQLRYMALESYELSFDSIAFPWLDVGDIAIVLDPDALPSDPSRYLMDTITIPMTLGPMSITGKRVTYVGYKEGDAIYTEEVA